MGAVSSRSVSIGPLTLYREPFFQLDHNIKIPIDKKFVEALAEYDMPPDDVEDYAIRHRPGYTFDRENGVQYWGSRKDSHASGTIYVFRVTYPAAFIVLVTKISASGTYPNYDDEVGYIGDEYYDFRFFIDDTVAPLEAVVAECAIAPHYEIYDAVFGQLVQAEVDREFGEVSNESNSGTDAVQKDPVVPEATPTQLSFDEEEFLQVLEELGEAAPSSLLANKIGKSEPATRKTAAKLKRKGIISHTRGRGYWLTSWGGFLSSNKAA